MELGSKTVVYTDDSFASQKQMCKRKHTIFVGLY
jgi:allantoicase